MVFCATVLRLDPVQSCLKVAANLHFKAKMAASKQVAAIFAEKGKFTVAFGRLYAGSIHAKRAE